MRVFSDRTDAGQRLGQALQRFHGTNPLVLAIPRGGVPVAAEIARALDGDLDIIVARKLGSPISAELAMGAVTADGVRYLNQAVIDDLQVTPQEIDAAAARECREAESRERKLRGGRPALPIEGRTVILVDDGLATGSTVIAAARSIRARDPARLIIAVPVGPEETCQAMRAEAGEVICLTIPEYFMAVGLHYRDFAPPTDEDVERILRDWQVPAETGASA
ncbi:MAG TPA: phosphoribosyltransferase family protein [Gemmatimonadaceae bacterium]